MITIFFGPLRPGPGAAGTGTAAPVAPVCCSAIVVCHLADRRRRLPGHHRHHRDD